MKTMTKDAMIVAPRQKLIEQINQQALIIDQLNNNVTELTMQLNWLKRQVFGTKSERFIPSDDQQMALDLGIVKKEDLDSSTVKKTVTYDRIDRKKKSKESVKGHGRGKMPDHLRVEEKVIEPQEDISGMVRTGEEITWYYEMDMPASLHVVKIIRPKYALPDNDGIIIGKLPVLPVEKGNAGPGLITQILIDKYVYHIPLNRQIAKYKSEYSVNFSESWFCDNAKNGIFWIEAVYNKYVNRIFLSNYLQADETPIPVLTKDKKGKTHRGYFWVYRNPVDKIIIFDYRKSRSREGPSDFLKNFKGTLQIDGYEGYNEIITRNNLKRAACMDHIRRRFEKALEYDKERANHSLDMMRQWYKLESNARENQLSPEDKLAMRRENIAPSMEAFKEWMLEQAIQVLPKSPIGVAISYALNQWPFFEPFLNDPRVDLSNILIENAIRPVALGRKNFMFAGSHQAAQRTAIIYSIIATSKMHNCDPFVYIKELLTKLPATKQRDIEKYLFPQWIPDNK
jgi:transposase